MKLDQIKAGMECEVWTATDGLRPAQVTSIERPRYKGDKCVVAVTWWTMFDQVRNGRFPPSAVYPPGETARLSA